MPIALITGPANAGKAQVVLDVVRRQIARGEEPLLIVPTRADAEHYLRELAGRHAAMGMRVQRFDDLIEEAVRRAGVREASLGGLGRERLIARVLERDTAMRVSPGLVHAAGALLAELQVYQAKAAGLGIDPFGYAFAPFGYAAGQILATAVAQTKGLDHARIAEYIHAHTFATVLGDIAYGKDGEWAATRTLFTQFQNVAPNNLEQFRTAEREVILWPEPYRTGTMIYPYSEARK
jgi:hypothetical protein